MKTISNLPERLDTHRLYVDWLCTYFVIIKYPIKYTCNCQNIEEELRNKESEIFITQRAHNVLLGLKAKNNINETTRTCNIPLMKTIHKASNSLKKDNMNKIQEEKKPEEEEKKLEVEKKVEVNSKNNVETDAQENIKDEIATLEAEKEYWNNFFDSNKDIILDFRKIKSKLELQGWA